ncbi:MAG: hypothetical protein CMB09_02890, partial [Euryarchaeota archaeon]|nr:hypothetical protein [Euryarchaeota archaeon]
MNIRPKHSQIGQFVRLGFLVFIVCHVIISAWLVVEFEGKYTEGAPAPTEIDAIVVVDREETLIDVKMEKSTSFLLYMISRDFDESYNETSNENSTQNESNNSSEGVDKENNRAKSEKTEWLKFTRNSVYFIAFILIISEITVLFCLRFSSVFRILALISFLLCFAILVPFTYVFDLAQDNEDDGDKIEESLSEETFVQNTESGSMAHEENSLDTKLIFPGIRFELAYSGYDLGLVEPEQYDQLRLEIPGNNSSLADSFVEFESNLDIKYGKNLPSILLIPLSWYILPSNSKKNRTPITSELNSTHTHQMWQINEQGLPGTGKVNLQEMERLLELSELSLGVFDDKKLLGFVLCLLPKTEYGSLNYAWFNQRYNQFIYVDRIAVAKDSRNSG